MELPEFVSDRDPAEHGDACNSSPAAFLSRDTGFHPFFRRLSAMLFGAGSAAGSIAIGFLVRKYRNAPFVLGGLVPGIPVVLLYFLFAGHPASCLLIMLGGLLASSCYPLLVSMSRRAEGTLPMSARMGIIVGGTWGIAGIALLAIGQIAPDRPCSGHAPFWFFI